MTDPLNIILAAFAGWRLAVMLHAEYGPLDVFSRIRNLAGIHEPEAPNKPRPFIGALLECMACLTVWTVGLFLALGALVSWAIPAAGAAMALALILHETHALSGNVAAYLKAATWRNS